MVTRGQSQSLMAPSQPQLTTRDVLGWVENTTRSVMTWWICISAYGKTAPPVLEMLKKQWDYTTNWCRIFWQINSHTKWGMTKTFKRFPSKIEIFGHFWDAQSYFIQHFRPDVNVQNAMTNVILSKGHLGLQSVFFVQDPQVLSNGLGWLHIKDF